MSVLPHCVETDWVSISAGTEPFPKDSHSLGNHNRMWLRGHVVEVVAVDQHNFLLVLYQKTIQLLQHIYKYKINIKDMVQSVL